MTIEIALYNDACDMANLGITHTPKFTWCFLSLIADAGFTSICWRVSNRGTFDYPSKIERFGMYSENGKSLSLVNDRIKSFDPLDVACQGARDAGIKLYAHVTMFDEGCCWSPWLYTFFAQKHPEFVMVDRDGRKCPWSDREYASALCYTYPEVREYRLSLLKEILAYDIDGILLDFYRWRESYDPYGGIHYGYDKPVVERFRQKHGEDPFQLPYNDPRWLAEKCLDMTVFLREFRHLWRKEKPGLQVATFLPRNTRLCLYSQLDLKTWAEEGLVHEHVIFNRFEAERGLHLFYKNYRRVDHQGREPERINDDCTPLAEGFEEVPYHRIGAEELARFRSLVGPNCKLICNIWPGRITGKWPEKIKLSANQFIEVAQAEMADGADGICFDEDLDAFNYLRAIRELAGRKV